MKNSLKKNRMELGTCSSVHLFLWDLWALSGEGTVSLHHWQLWERKSGQTTVLGAQCPGPFSRSHHCLNVSQSWVSLWVQLLPPPTTTAVTAHQHCVNTNISLHQSCLCSPSQQTGKNDSKKQIIFSLFLWVVNIFFWDVNRGLINTNR